MEETEERTIVLEWLSASKLEEVKEEWIYGRTSTFQEISTFQTRGRARSGEGEEVTWRAEIPLHSEHAVDCQLFSLSSPPSNQWNSVHPAGGGGGDPQCLHSNVYASVFLHPTTTSLPSPFFKAIFHIYFVSRFLIFFACKFLIIFSKQNPPIYSGFFVSSSGI